MSVAVSPSSPADPDRFAVVNQPLKRYTRKEYDDLVALGAFHGQRIELLFGLLVTMSRKTMAHVNGVQATTKLLYNTLRGRADVFNQSPFAASEDSEPEPDVFVTDLIEGRRQAHAEHAHLIVEVSESSLCYDRGEKAGLYARSNVVEYWVVDVAAETIEVRRDRRDGEWHDVRTYARGEAIALVAFPDVVVRVDDIV